MKDHFTIGNRRLIKVGREKKKKSLKRDEFKNTFSLEK